MKALILAGSILAALLFVSTSAAAESQEPGWIERYQTGLGALFGLLGLAFVAWLNASMTRWRDERLRAEEAHSLATALFAEIGEIKDTMGSMRSVFKMRHAEGDQPPNAMYTRLTMESGPIFANNCDRLGLLPDGVVTTVVRFHETINLFKQHCRAGEKFDVVDPSAGNPWGALDFFAAQIAWNGGEAIAALTAFRDGKTLPVIRGFSPDVYTLFETPAEDVGKPDTSAAAEAKTAD